MESAEKYQSEAEVIFRRWLDNTVKILEQERAKLKVEDKKGLKDSLRGKVIQMAANELGGQIYFLTRGRFVDMGAGRKKSITRFGEDPKKMRKPKKWYSRPFYGRLNDLQGALGIRLMEQGIEAIRKGLI